MASIGIQSAKIVHQSFLPTNKSTQIFSSNNSIVSVSMKKIPLQIASASIVSPNRGSVPVDSDGKDADSHRIIDSMMHDSVADIVKNLKQAPLLVQIFSENDGIRVHTEKAVLENWPLVKENWRSDGSSGSQSKSKSPDGLIFVEELGQENGELGQTDGVTRAWGVIVQGKGVECGPACYLLKTNRVCGGFGLGFCTHFCLMRVNNFRDSAFQQFKDLWLLQ